QFTRLSADLTGLGYWWQEVSGNTIPVAQHASLYTATAHCRLIPPLPQRETSSADSC
ncbi:hypothetical protein CEXT_438601, partial [Caerostris extrusa]